MTAGAFVPMILDGLVIILLAGTIFYAGKLSTGIRMFRADREALEKLIADLAVHIEKAERAIVGLRETARESGRNLQALVNEAQAIGEELQIMSESGNSLAARLEKAAEGSARPHRREQIFDAESLPRKGVAGFAIHDPDFDAESMDEQGMMPGDYEEENEEGAFASRAEQELYEALLKRGKTRAGAGSLS